MKDEFEFCKRHSKRCGDPNYVPKDDVPEHIEWAPPRKYMGKTYTLSHGDNDWRSKMGPVLMWLADNVNWLWKLLTQNKFKLCFNHYLENKHGLYAHKTKHGTAYVPDTVEFANRKPIVQIRKGKKQWKSSDGDSRGSKSPGQDLVDDTHQSDVSEESAKEK